LPDPHILISCGLLKREMALFYDPRLHTGQ
jgi:hypothetical protein